MKDFIEGTYYEGLGRCLGKRETHSFINGQKKESLDYIFSTGKKDLGGAVYLNKVNIYEK